jgi:hypothetical protein
MDNLKSENALRKQGVIGGAGQSELPANSTRKIRPPRKWVRILSAFVRGENLNRFEALKRYHDTCLHSTVAGLENRGVMIERKDEKVPGYMGIPTHVCRYWLAPGQLQAALRLLGELP